MCPSRTAGESKAPRRLHLRAPHRRSGCGPSIRGVPLPPESSLQFITLCHDVPLLVVHGEFEKHRMQAARCLNMYALRAMHTGPRSSRTLLCSLHGALPSNAAVTATFLLAAESAESHTTVVLLSSRLARAGASRRGSQAFSLPPPPHAPRRNRSNIFAEAALGMHALGFRLS